MVGGIIRQSLLIARFGEATALLVDVSALEGNQIIYIMQTEN